MIYWFNKYGQRLAKFFAKGFVSFESKIFLNNLYNYTYGMSHIILTKGL